MIEPELKTLLEANLELSKENNKLLKKVRRVQKIARNTKIVYWLFIVAIAFGAYYYVQPFVKKMTGFLPALSGLEGGLKNLPDLKGLNELLKK